MEIIGDGYNQTICGRKTYSSIDGNRLIFRLGLGEPDRYCRTRYGIAHLYHAAHVAAAEATEWFITRPYVVAPRLYIGAVVKTDR